jgi:hypothetical protein
MPVTTRTGLVRASPAIRDGRQYPTSFDLAPLVNTELQYDCLKRR